jgi:hypothetical protein
MFRKLTHKRSLFALAALAALTLAGAAFAYFSSTGSGTGHAQAGTSTPFAVTVAAPTGGPLYPGAGSMALSYTVNNPSTGVQQLASTTATVASGTGGVITQAGIAVPGCLAVWFSASITPPGTLPQSLIGGATTTAGTVTVTMPSNTLVSQDSCQGKSPDITVSAA